jgi:hypothetical protein
MEFFVLKVGFGGISEEIEGSLKDGMTGSGMEFGMPYASSEEE